MLKRIILIGLFLLILAPVQAQDNLAKPTQIIIVSSGNVAAATATATITAQPGYLNRLCGFSISSSGSTSAAVVSPTITGLRGGTVTYTYVTVAGVTLGNTILERTFTPCLPASGPNVAIVVSLPSLGTGNTNATVNAQGYQTQFP